MTKLKIIVICLMIIGCSNRRDGDLAVHMADCSEDQMKKAERETKYCIDNSLLDKAFCYKSAIGRNCSVRIL